MHRGHGSRAATLAALAVILLWGSSARTDVVRPPPRDCPAGSIGRSGHSGPYCSPAMCRTSADCRGGAACEVAKLCITPKTLHNRRRPDSPPVVVERVTGSCAGGKKCEDGRCQSVRVCMPKAQKRPTSAAVLAGCGCSVGWTGGVGWALGVVALGALALVRRGSRRRRRQLVR